MKVNSQNISFKGYDAAPLKSIYTDGTGYLSIDKELKEACKKENIEKREVRGFYKWAQDDKAIVEKEGKPVLISNKDHVQKHAFPQMDKMYEIKGRMSKDFITGGNSFIGKLPNGEKWLMAGKEELSEHDLSKVSKDYGIDVKNIYPISSPNFHLDLFLRPIGYPYVLVNDPVLAKEKLEEMDDGSSEFQKVKEDFDSYEEERSSKYASCDTVCKELEEQGFVPIRIAGVFGSHVNFMNAIVNRHPDGKISYITNSSKCKDPYYTKLQELFEKDLREKADLDKVYFMNGGNCYGFIETNYMMDMLNKGHGGVHCMTMEEPDFKSWV